MNKPLISVIIPVYNVAKYLPRCLDSVIGQTYNNLEIILVDDGSTDNSLEICNQYAAKDKRITAIHQANGGLSAARNSGMDHMHGEFFTFIDSDDWFTKDAIEILFNLYQNTNADITWGSFTTVIGNKCFPKALPNLFKPDNLKSLSTEQMLVLSFVLEEHAAWGKLFNTKKFGALRFNGFYAVSEDLDFFFQVLQHFSSAAYTHTSILFYYKRPHSITKSYYFDEEYKIITQYKEIRNFCLKNHFYKPISLLDDYCNSLRLLITIRIILYGDESNTKLLKELHSWIKENLLQIRTSSRLRSPGKVFAICFSCIPFLVPFLRLPGIKHFLRYLVEKRLTPSQ